MNSLVCRVDVMPTKQNMRSKCILVLGGSPREVIDGVRHYANRGRDQSHGARTANALVALGATVTFITVKSSSAHLPYSGRIIDTVDGRKIASAKDLLAACALQSSEAYDAVVQLASIASIVPAQPSDHKLKVKGHASELVSLEVVGNVDVATSIRSLFPGTRVVGYDNRQQWFGGGDDALEQTIREVADGCAIPEPSRQISHLIQSGVPENKTLKGRKAIVTSGPTAEPITASGDVITNFSSGRQGHAVAEGLALLGAEVVLVSGPTSLCAPAHEKVRTINVSSAEDMYQAVIAELPADVFVGVAAVADFTMQSTLERSPEEAEALTLQLRQNPDILRTVGTHASLRPSVVVGFAAETHDVLEYARDKLNRKGADFICANQVGNAMASRSSGVNAITFVMPSGHEGFPEVPKLEAGKMIGAKIAQLLTQKMSST